MPWTGSSFRTRHAKNLSASQAKKAAQIANAMLSGGADEGMSIATAIKRAKRSRKTKTNTVLTP